MKLMQSNGRGRAGIMLMECMMYIVVLSVLLGIGFEAFYKCWDNSEALGKASNQVLMAVLAGERWRDDVHSATGKIVVSTNTDGQTFRIPHGRTAITYSFNSGELRRTDNNGETVVLAQVKMSQMEINKRAQASAYSWELEVASHNAKTRMPLLFTFIAAAPHAP